MKNLLLLAAASLTLTACETSRAAPSKGGGSSPNCDLTRSDQPVFGNTRPGPCR